MYGVVHLDQGEKKYNQSKAELALPLQGCQGQL